MFTIDKSRQYLIYKKINDHYLNQSVIMPLSDIIYTIRRELEKIIKLNRGLVVRSTGKPILIDDYYTNKKRVYSYEELDSTKKLLEILKEGPLYPLVNDNIINNPITYGFITSCLKNGIIGDSTILDSTIKEIVEKYSKLHLINFNHDLDYIYDDFGIRNPMLYKYIRNESNRIQALRSNIDSVILEELFYKDNLETTYYLEGLIKEDYEVTDTYELINLLLNIDNIILDKLTKYMDKSLNTRFSLETEFINNNLIVSSYLPYSSLRAEVIKLTIRIENEYNKSKYNT